MYEARWTARARDKRVGPGRPTTYVVTLLAVWVSVFATPEELGAQDGLTPETLESELERIRETTEAFRDITAAHAAGYPTEVPACVENPPEGGMGHHYIHPGLMDGRLEVERPEVLVYAPGDGGDLKLAGVEYIVPYSANGPDESPPHILGQDLQRSDQLQLWYLHVWAWEENPNGLFADWNPLIHCDGSPRSR